jgi:hypothetical protein
MNREDGLLYELDNLTRLFFKRMCSNRDCLQYLVPDQRSVDILSKLRQPKTLPGILYRTERFLKSVFAIRSI